MMVGLRSADLRRGMASPRRAWQRPRLLVQSSVKRFIKKTAKPTRGTHEPMKITKVETFKHWVDWCNWLFVKISTDEGLCGWGEASLHGALQSVDTAIHEFAEHLISQDPAGPEAHWHRLYNAWR